VIRNLTSKWQIVANLRRMQAAYAYCISSLGLTFQPTGQYVFSMQQHPARTRLLNASLNLVRQTGFAAMRVDDVCHAAGVSKGAFFHHFQSKEAFGVATAQHWDDVTAPFFSSAPYHTYEDPLDQLIAYIDFRAQIIVGEIPEFTCVVGTMVQEVHATHPAIRDACFNTINHHANTVLEMIKAAKTRHAPHASWSAESLALHTQAVIQGAFILAKAQNSAQIAKDTVLHLRRYIELLFHHAKED
jgi:TetR/AcrR family transcriptional regulator, transcriptional repressor for nem operon